MRAYGHDVLAAGQFGLARSRDDALVLYAAQQGRVFLTHNLKDFRLLHDAWHRWSTAWGVAPRHPGIVIYPQGWPPVRAGQELASLLHRIPPGSNTLYVWEIDRWVDYPGIRPVVTRS